MKITPLIQNFNINIGQQFLNDKKISFKSREIQNDIYETSNPKQEIYLKVYNPYTHSFSMDNVKVDLSRPQTLEIKDNSRRIYKGQPLKINYNPERIDYLFDKKSGKPFKTVILNTVKDNSVCFNFMSEDLQKEFGYVTFTKWSNEDILNANMELFSTLYANYPKVGLEGERIIVDYLQNWNDNEIGGVGHLADKLIVKHCLDNNFPIKIIAVADRGSHMAHYIQGRRFLPLEEGSREEQYYNEIYGCSKINEILKSKMQKNNKGKIQLDMGFVALYYPEELIQKYINELLSES